MPRLSRERGAALAFALARTLLCGYRAFQQGVTVDEASTFNNYLHGDWARIYRDYDPNNHIFFSLVTKAFVQAFGLSEFKLRVVSLLAGLFLTLGIYYVLEATVASRWIRWAALVTLGISPMLLDLNIAARGYGLALAFLIWAVYFTVRGRRITAGVLLGLGVASNLTIAFPAAGVIACPLLLGKDGFWKRVDSALELAIPCAALAAAICYPALAGVKASQFYLGEPTIGKSVLNLVFTTFHNTVDRDGLFANMTGVLMIQYVVLPVLMLFMIVAGIAAFRRERPWSLAPLIALLGAMAALVTAHGLFKVNYPVDRAGMYLVLLLGLAWAVAADSVPLRTARAASGVLAVAAAAQFLTQFETHYFGIWAFDFPMKQVARQLQRECQGQPPNTIAVSASPFHQPALEFYRYYYHIDALKPVERREHAALQGFDYYVLNLKDDDAARAGDTKRLSALFSEPLSGLLLAKEPAKSQ